MLNDNYLFKLGRLVKNTYGVDADDQRLTDYDIGRVVMGMVLYLYNEQERDLRDQANGKGDL